MGYHPSCAHFASSEPTPQKTADGLATPALAFRGEVAGHSCVRTQPAGISTDRSPTSLVSSRSSHFPRLTGAASSCFARPTTSSSASLMLLLTGIATDQPPEGVRHQFHTWG